tara:strand:+ start:1792 stop:3519 length:1728 start_codon:yes stop_codon:yes gene_type:complete
MPTIPTVFRPLRKNDVQHKPFYTYKNYTITDSNYDGSGCVLQLASHLTVPQTLGDTTTSYNNDINFQDNSNRHIIWNSLDHKYYRHPFNPDKTLELTNINKTDKFLFMSGSTLSIPYGMVGEKIKHNSLIVNSNIKGYKSFADYSVSLYDDGYGNLKDTAIISASFAKKSNSMFHLSFNNLYRKFPQNLGLLNTYNPDTTFSNVRLQPGVVVTNSSNTDKSGLSGYFTNSLKSYIQLNDTNIFNTLGKCDDWTISLWIKPVNTLVTGSLISKAKISPEKYYDRVDGKIKDRDNIINIPIPGIGNFTEFKTPIQLSLYDQHIHFQSSDGSSAIHISSSANYRNEWMHVLVSNSASVCNLYINSIKSGTSGSLPRKETSNTAYTFIGSHGRDAADSFQGNIAEVRMYDYAATQTEISSLANQNFHSGSLYQNSTPGNIFYKNGQLVVSSPLPKYNSMFISSSNSIANNFKVTYKSTHTIYENEVLVRVPKGAANVSVNPSATYRPSTGYDNTCSDQEKDNGPGEFRKSIFLSGSAMPYITTVGLYDDKARLLAVGKFAEPVQKRNDIDMNFVIRWDY